MYCSNCGKHAQARAKFCAHCGQSIARSDIQQFTTAETTNRDHHETAKIPVPENRVKAVVTRVISVAAILVGLALGRSLGAAYWVVALIVGVPYWAGDRIAAWYVKRDNISSKFIEVISWSNVITWLLPPLGMLTGAMTVKFNQYNTNERGKYALLGWGCVVASIVNALIGVYLKIWGA